LYCKVCLGLEAWRKDHQTAARNTLRGVPPAPFARGIRRSWTASWTRENHLDRETWLSLPRNGSGLYYHCAADSSECSVW